MHTIYKAAAGVVAMLLSGVAISQSFTNCIPYVAGRPDQGMNCSTTNYGNNSNGSPGNAMDAFQSGYNASGQVRRDSDQNNMINKARQDCNNGVARACEYLKQNNVY
jgi:hypothetical protein